MAAVLGGWVGLTVTVWVLRATHVLCQLDVSSEAGPGGYWSCPDGTAFLLPGALGGLAVGGAMVVFVRALAQREGPLPGAGGRPARHPAR